MPIQADEYFKEWWENQLSKLLDSFSEREGNMAWLQEMRSCRCILEWTAADAGVTRWSAILLHYKQITMREHKKKNTPLEIKVPAKLTPPSGTTLGNIAAAALVQGNLSFTTPLSRGIDSRNDVYA